MIAMKRTHCSKSGLLIGALLCLLFSGVSAGAEPPGELPVLTVSGEGKVSVQPDQAIIVLGAEQQAATAAAAQETVARVMNDVSAAVQKQGVAKENLRTTMINVSPVYEGQMKLSSFGSGQGGGIVGFLATSRMEVRSSDLKKIGALIDASMEAGANRVEGLRFSVADNTEPYRDALWAAVEDARSKAETIAKVAGVKVGEPVSIVEGGRSIPRGEAVVAFSRAGTTVEPGLVTVQAQVEVRFRLDVKGR